MEFINAIFGRGADGVKLLQRPQSVCVSGQYVWVVDKRAVSVFTTVGDHVTTFRNCCGKEKGRFNFPLCVCADMNSVVYVTDIGVSNIQIF